LNFEFNDDQRQLHDAVERYLNEQYGFDRYKSIKGSAAGWDPAVWRSLADMGVLAITVPVAQGGLGFGPVETLAMMGDCEPESLARAHAEQRRHCDGSAACIRR
jgi:alkylation response protein AidB-like acyl-CoA dehydrogenase